MAGDAFIFAGGGTGGHLFPAIAIADELRRRQPGSDITFIGTRNKIEANVVPQHGYRFETIWISGFQRRKLLSNVLLPLKMVVALIQAMMILKKYHPAVVIGTGGYVSGPVLMAASMMKIPSVVHEQNSIPGSTTMAISRRATEIHLTFESSRCHFKRQNNVFVSGNPTRDSLENIDISAACKYFNFNKDDKRKTLLVFGGSLGARTINNAVAAMLDKEMPSGIRIIWQTGKEEFEQVQHRFSHYIPGSLWIGPFIDKMEYAYALSNLVVSRAGATTIAELTRLGKPAILVPYPFAAADHQTENAHALESQGAAKVIADSSIAKRIGTEIQSLMQNDALLQTMSMNSKRLGKSEAARTIVEHIFRLTHNESNMAAAV